MQPLSVLCRGPSSRFAGTNVQRSGQPVAHPPHYSLHGKRADCRDYAIVLQYCNSRRSALCAGVCREARRCREARCVRRCAEKRAVFREAGLCAEKCWGQGSAGGEAQAAYKPYGRGATGLCVPVAAARCVRRCSSRLDVAGEKWRCWFSSNAPSDVRMYVLARVPCGSAFTVLPGASPEASIMPTM